MVHGGHGDQANDLCWLPAGDAAEAAGGARLPGSQPGRGGGGGRRGAPHLTLASCSSAWSPEGWEEEGWAQPSVVQVWTPPRDLL